MGYEHSLTSKSQVTVPKDVRKVLGLNPGDKVRFEVEQGGKVVLRRGMQPPAETAEQRKIRIRAALVSVAGSIDLGGMTTDDHMREIRGGWEP